MCKSGESEKCATVKMDGIEEDCNRGSSIGTRQDVKVQGPSKGNGGVQKFALGGPISTLECKATKDWNQGKMKVFVSGDHRSTSLKMRSACLSILKVDAMTASNIPACLQMDVPRLQACIFRKPREWSMHGHPRIQKVRRPWDMFSANRIWHHPLLLEFR
ncbi:hypothetical protein ACFE04_031323 [Oxalis oulophora]